MAYLSEWNPGISDRTEEPVCPSPECNCPSCKAEFAGSALRTPSKTGDLITDLMLAIARAKDADSAFRLGVALATKEAKCA